MMTILFVFCLSVGERLEYVGEFGFLQVGRLTLEVKDTIDYNGNKCYWFSSVISSNPRFKFLFSINDTIDVYTRCEDLLPLFCEEKINEGEYHNYTKLSFWPESLQVIYDDSISMNIYKDTRDLLTFWYYLRTIPLSIGDTIKLNIHKSKKNYKINCFIKEEALIKTSAGEFNTILVEPETRGKGLFGPQGKMGIWYSVGQARYPVQIKTRMKFGSITFKLKEVCN